MRKAVVLTLSSLFFYALFRDMTPIKTLLLCAAIISAFAVSRVPSRFIKGAKYPLVALSLALSPALIAYPAFKHSLPVVCAAIFLSFYSTALFLVTMEEKGKQVYKEVIGLSLLYAAAFLNLYLTGQPALVCPLSACVLLFLFIIDKVRIMPFIAAYAVMAVIFLAVKGVGFFGTSVVMNGVERYLLLGVAFALLLVTFVAFFKRPDFAAVLGFFGLLYISVDLLLSVGLTFKSILLQQPALALLIVAPLMGMVLKGEKERL